MSCDTESQTREEPVDYSNNEALNKEIIFNAIMNGAVFHRCPKCLKIFGKNKYLKLHLKYTHKSLMYFPCKFNPLCLKLFKTEEDKLKHYKAVHSWRICWFLNMKSNASRNFKIIIRYKCFERVYPFDKLRSFNDYPYAMVINTYKQECVCV